MLSLAERFEQMEKNVRSAESLAIQYEYDSITGDDIGLDLVAHNAERHGYYRLICELTKAAK